MGAALTVRIPIKDPNGRIIDEKEVATYAGLLAKAHEEGLKAITTKLLQVPTPDNGEVAIVEATVETDKGTYSGIGDAAPGNVNRKVAAHLIRMAESRAKARALRDAVNIGTVALEELGGEDDVSSPVRASAPASGNVRQFPRLPDRAPAQDRRPAEPAEPRRTSPPAPARPDAGRPDRMTENQRKLLYRMLSERGFEGADATDALCAAAEVKNVGDITKADASALIDAWKREVEGA